MAGLIGRKVGMTQIFKEDGVRIPVTVIDVSDNVLIQKKTSEGADGYNSVKVGFVKADRQEKAGMVRHRGVNKAEGGVFTKAGIETPYRHVREFRCSATQLDGLEIGQILTAEDTFSEGQQVDVTGTSKGRGFTGVIKRHGYHMPRKTHGTHENFRHGGSIGQSAWPGKVWKGKKMPGQHGGRRVTNQNIEVVQVISDENLVLVKGSIPGANGSVVTIKPAVKKARGSVQAK